ncbi:MAG: carboxypeptidase-like regulatory domain-containing protein [Bacteroidota bacterium]
MADEVRAEYPCTGQELYSIGNTIYDNVKANLAPFTALKAKYTDAYVDGLKLNITNAKALPDEEMRNSIFQTLGVELKVLEEKCCENFQDLKNYIDDSYEDNLHKIKYDAAGAPKYEAAKAGNHERVAGLNADMIAFIAAESATLLVNLDGDPNMPVGFEAMVIADSGKFDTKYAAFKLARQTTLDTNKKTKANNDCFKEIMSTCDDGIRVAAKSADVSGMTKLFTFKTVKDLVSPPGSASLKITLKLAVDGSFIVGADVSVQAAGGAVLKGVTDVNGVVLFDKIDPADYNVTISGTGIPAPITFIKEVNTGVQARKEVLV